VAVARNARPSFPSRFHLPRGATRSLLVRVFINPLPRLGPARFVQVYREGWHCLSPSLRRPRIKTLNPTLQPRRDAPRVLGKGKAHRTMYIRA